MAANGTLFDNSAGHQEPDLAILLPVVFAVLIIPIFIYAFKWVRREKRRTLMYGSRPRPSDNSINNDLGPLSYLLDHHRSARENMQPRLSSVNRSTPLISRSILRSPHQYRTLACYVPKPAKALVLDRTSSESLGHSDDILYDGSPKPVRGLTRQFHQGPSRRVHVVSSDYGKPFSLYGVSEQEQMMEVETSR